MTAGDDTNFGGGLRAPAFAFGLALVLLVTALDVVAGKGAILIPLLVVGPLLTGMRGGIADVGLVGFVAVVLALLLGIVDGIFGESDHVVTTLAVAAGSVIAAAATRARALLAGTARANEEELARERRARVRADLLARAGEVLASSLDPQEMLARVTELAVPELGNVAVLDVLDGDGMLRGSVLTARDHDVAERVRELRRRFPIDRGGQHPVAVALRTGEPQLTAMLSDDTLRRITSDDDHYDMLRAAEFRSTMALPLQARGRTAGVLTYVRGGETSPYDEEDLELGRQLAARAALALDNARLFSELRAAEGRLEAIVSNLGEAVSALAPDGSFVFANDAAAEVAGFASAQELLSASTDEIIKRFVLIDEAGDPIPIPDLPFVRALRGEHPPPLVARAVSRETGQDRWFISRAEPVHDAVGALELVVTVAEDVTVVKRQEARQRLLANASKLLTSSLDIEATVDKAAWAAVPELADWARIDLVGDRGLLQEAAVAHRDLERQELLREWRRRYPPDPADNRGPHEVLREGKAILWKKVDPEDVARYAQDDEHARIMRTIDTRSMIIVPLMVGERRLGTLQLATTGESDRLLTEGEVELAEELARRAAIAVENARVHAARTHIATTLQRSLLPPRLPVIPGLTIAARFRAAGGLASDVGGDFYDLFAARENWMVVMGDVTGKGPGAAAITSLARYTLRTAASYEDDPRAVVERLNLTLAADADHRQLCTAVCVVVRRGENGMRLEVTCAGHPAPLLVSPGGRVRPVGPPGTLLGAFAQGTWRSETVDVQAGDALVLYTDGVTDTRGEHGRFGSDRLEALLREVDTQDPDEIAGRIDHALRAFGEQRDDVALLVLGVDPSSPGEASIVGMQSADQTVVARADRRAAAAPSPASSTAAPLRAFTGRPAAK